MKEESVNPCPTFREDEDKATPRPLKTWIIAFDENNPDDDVILVFKKEEMATKVVHRVNNFDRLVEALGVLARLGNGDQYGNSDGNRIAQAALTALKEA